MGNLKSGEVWETFSNTQLLTGKNTLNNLTPQLTGSLLPCYVSKRQKNRCLPGWKGYIYQEGF